MDRAPFVVRRLFELVDARRWHELVDVVADNVEYHRPGYAPIQGRDQYLHFYQHVRRIDRGRHVIEDVVSDGDRAGCWGHFTGVAVDGTPLSVQFSEWYVFHGDLIAVRRTFFDAPAV